ncbi:MAG: hypothetical protein GY765_17690, partial [bacterium]|nr:hypothetical protein [bacterium]
MKKNRFREFFSVLKHSLQSLHHILWGKGWRRFFIAVLITAVLLALILTISLEVTSTPRFCSVCHNMKPYYESWKTSTHKDV